jgi:hypothetical protein
MPCHDSADVVQFRDATALWPIPRRITALWPTPRRRVMYLVCYMYRSRGPCGDQAVDANHATEYVSGIATVPYFLFSRLEESEESVGAVGASCC